jgi:hypothetical protein
MNDKELLEKADEFLDMAFLGDGKEQCLMYKMKSRLEELTTDKKEPEPQPTSIVWEPKKGDKYYFVGSDGTVQVTDWRGDQLDKELLKHHNVYKTREQAEKAAQYQSRYNMVLQAVINLEPDQVVYWKDDQQVKYEIYFNYEEGLWDKCWTFCGVHGYPVLTDEKNVQPLLDYLNSKEKENG